MKSKYKYEVISLDDGLVAVPIGDGTQQFHGVLKVNETAMAILKLLETETSVNQIINVLSEEYTCERDQIAIYVNEFINKLSLEGLLEQ